LTALKTHCEVELLHLLTECCKLFQQNISD